jgi:hypothetical protein
MPRRNILVKIQRQGPKEDYTYAFVIAGKNLKLKSSANGTVYSLCDIVETLPQTIDCHGITRPVICVIKLYAKVAERDLKKQNDNRRYQALLKGKMILSE